MEGEREFVYLSGLPIQGLLTQVAQLPDRSIIYYLNVFQGKKLQESDTPATARCRVRLRRTVYALARASG
jgi:hypothetical protein